MEVKVGQVWREKFAHREFTVLPHEEYQLIDNETTWLWSAPASDFGSDLELVKDAEPELSDLEIVQKALVKTGSTLHLYSDGSSQTVGGYFENSESLLTWAKQTIGGE